MVPLSAWIRGMVVGGSRFEKYPKDVHLDQNETNRNESRERRDYRHSLSSILYVLITLDLRDIGRRQSGSKARVNQREIGRIC